MQLSLLKILPRFPVLKVKSLNKASTLIEFYFFLYFVISKSVDLANKSYNLTKWTSSAYLEISQRLFIMQYLFSLRGEGMVHKTILTPTHLLKCLYQVRKVSGHVYVLGISIFPLSTNFWLDFGTVSTVWYFRTVSTVWYFRTVSTVWYFRTFDSVVF